LVGIGVDVTSGPTFEDGRRIRDGAADDDDHAAAARSARFTGSHLRRPSPAAAERVASPRGRDRAPPVDLDPACTRAKLECRCSVVGSACSSSAPGW
jgi:hypothetical protein